MSEDTDVQGASTNAVAISADNPRSLSHDEPDFKHLVRQSLHSALKGEKKVISINLNHF
jgi:hypothetical protein